LISCFTVAIVSSLQPPIQFPFLTDILQAPDPNKIVAPSGVTPAEDELTTLNDVVEMMDIFFLFALEKAQHVSPMEPWLHIMVNDILRRMYPYAFDDTYIASFDAEIDQRSISTVPNLCPAKFQVLVVKRLRQIFTESNIIKPSFWTHQNCLVVLEVYRESFFLPVPENMDTAMEAMTMTFELFFIRPAHTIVEKLGSYQKVSYNENKHLSSIVYIG
jgi:hypothetical protein